MDMCKQRKAIRNNFATLTIVAQCYKIIQSIYSDTPRWVDLCLQGNMNSQNDQIFEVEKILKKKIVKGKVMYLIKWLGYPNKFSNWEPEEHILDSTLIQDFERKQASKRKRKVK